MKTTLLTAALLSTMLLAAAPAHAASWYLPNEAGGRIILSDRDCTAMKDSGLMDAYTYNASGTRQGGCWAVFDGLVQIIWVGGQRSVFPTENFTKSEAAPVAPVKTPSRRAPASL